VIEGEALDLVGVALATDAGRAALKQSRVVVHVGPRGAVRMREILAELFDLESTGKTAG
jgi:hypothetical protein